MSQERCIKGSDELLAVAAAQTVLVMLCIPQTFMQFTAVPVCRSFYPKSVTNDVGKVVFGASKTLSPNIECVGQKQPDMNNYSGIVALK